MNTVVAVDGLFCLLLWSIELVNGVWISLDKIDASRSICGKARTKKKVRNDKKFTQYGERRERATINSIIATLLYTTTHVQWVQRVKQWTSRHFVSKKWCVSCTLLRHDQRKTHGNAASSRRVDQQRAFPLWGTIRSLGWEVGIFSSSQCRNKGGRTDGSSQCTPKQTFIHSFHCP
jgi:hypothetical protein